MDLESRRNKKYKNAIKILYGIGATTVILGSIGFGYNIGLLIIKEAQTNQQSDKQQAELINTTKDKKQQLLDQQTNLKNELNLAENKLKGYIHGNDQPKINSTTKNIQALKNQINTKQTDIETQTKIIKINND